MEPTKVLTLIVDPAKADKGSRGYVKSIKRIAKLEEFRDIITINVRECTHQCELEFFLESTNHHVILIEPTTLELKPQDEYRNADDNEVAHVVADMIEDRSNELGDHSLNEYTDRILILGRKRVGKKIHELVAYDQNFTTAIKGSMPFLNNTYLWEHKVLINCVPSDEIISLPFNSLVYDVAGTFKTCGIKSGSSDNRWREYPQDTEIVDCRTIGDIATRRMLTGVKNRNI